jgi:zinc D-Ala-D-Ala carboxypeptidase
MATQASAAVIRGGLNASNWLMTFALSMTGRSSSDGFRGFGFYPRSGFIHIDLGPARQWGERFPKRASGFAVETPPVRESLGESRTLKGGGAAGVATVGAAGVEVAQQVLAETQDAVLPLVPYLDTLRGLFIAVAFGGIAVAIYTRLDDWRMGRR